MIKNWSLADKSATLLALSAILLFVVKRTWLDLCVAPVALFVPVGLIVEGAISSLVAGSVFFLVVNRLSETKERAIIDPWITKKKAFIVGQYDAIIGEVSKASGISLSVESSQADFLVAFSAILVNSSAPLVNFVGTPFTWMPYFKYQLDRMQFSISSLLNRGWFLSATEILEISELEDHHLFSMVNSIISAPMGPGQTLHFCASSFHGIGVKLQALR